MREFVVHVASGPDLLTVTESLALLAIGPLDDEHRNAIGCVADDDSLSTIGELVEQLNLAVAEITWEPGTGCALLAARADGCLLLAAGVAEVVATTAMTTVELGVTAFGASQHLVVEWAVEEVELRRSAHDNGNPTSVDRSTDLDRGSVRASRALLIGELAGRRAATASTSATIGPGTPAPSNDTGAAFAPARATGTGVATSTRRTPSTVTGVRCVAGHLVPPTAERCSTCDADVDPFSATLVLGERPVLGMVVLPDGRRVPLDQDLIVGRAPNTRHRDAPALVRSVVVNEVGVADSHLVMILDGWDVSVTPLGADSQVTILRDGHRIQLDQDHPERLQLDDSLLVAPGVELEVELHHAASGPRQAAARVRATRAHSYPVPPPPGDED